MLKEIQSSCGYEDAQVLTNIADKYPVTVGILPSNLQDTTIVTFSEKEEGTIGARFFGDMQTLLDYAALFEQLEQEDKIRVMMTSSQQIPVASQIPERAVATPAVHRFVITALWSGFKSLFESGAKQLRHSDRTV